jgi:DHA1 family bicyclomycin/chloramphenicol resistance-like MFS transporter
MFAVNALGIVAAGQLNRAVVGRFGPRGILCAAVAVQAAAGLALLAVVAVGGLGVWPVVALLFVVVAAIGLVVPNGTALALADHPRVAGSASALLGVLQFSVGAATAPLVGVAGSTSALPMAGLIAVMGVGAVLAATVVARAPRSGPVAAAA